jgi:hypothetical protein
MKPAGPRADPKADPIDNRFVSTTFAASPRAEPRITNDPTLPRLIHDVS